MPSHLSLNGASAHPSTLLFGLPLRECRIMAQPARLSARVKGFAGGSGDAFEGGRYPPPPPDGASLRPATIPLTSSVSFSGICNRQ